VLEEVKEQQRAQYEDKIEDLKQSHSNYIKQLSKHHEAEVESLQQQQASFVAQLSERHATQLTAVQRHVEDTLASRNAQNQLQVSELQATLEAQKAQLAQLQQAKKEVEQEFHAAEEKFHTQLRATAAAHSKELTDLQLTQQKLLNTQVQEQLAEVYKKHGAEITALREETTAKVKAMADTHTLQMEQLRQQQERKLQELRKQNEEHLAQLAAQHSQQLKGAQEQYNAEIARRDVTYQKQVEEWSQIRDSLTEQYQQERSQLAERVAFLEQILYEKQSELCERTEIQRGLADLMARANNLLGPRTPPVSGRSVARTPASANTMTSPTPHATANASATGGSTLIAPNPIPSTMIPLSRTLVASATKASIASPSVPIKTLAYQDLSHEDSFLEATSPVGMATEGSTDENKENDTMVRL